MLASIVTAELRQQTRSYSFAARSMMVRSATVEASECLFSSSRIQKADGLQSTHLSLAASAASSLVSWNEWFTSITVVRDPHIPGRYRRRTFPLSCSGWK